MIKANTRTGHLDQQITLQQSTQGVDANGGPIETFATLQTVFARVEYAKTGSGEDYTDAVNLNTNRVLFTFHYREDVGEKDRIVWNGRNYDIVRIAMDGRRMYTTATADYKA